MIVLKWRVLSLLPRIRIKSPKLWLVMFYRMPYTLILPPLTLLLFTSLALSHHFRLAPTVRLWNNGAISASDICFRKSQFLCKIGVCEMLVTYFFIFLRSVKCLRFLNIIKYVQKWTELSDSWTWTDILKQRAVKLKFIYEKILYYNLSYLTQWNNTVFQY